MARARSRHRLAAARTGNCSASPSSARAECPRATQPCEHLPYDRRRCVLSLPHRRRQGSVRVSRPSGGLRPGAAHKYRRSVPMRFLRAYVSELRDSGGLSHRRAGRPPASLRTTPVATDRDRTGTARAGRCTSRLRRSLVPPRRAASGRPRRPCTNRTSAESLGRAGCACGTARCTRVSGAGLATRAAGRSRGQSPRCPQRPASCGAGLSGPVQLRRRRARRACPAELGRSRPSLMRAGRWEAWRTTPRRLRSQ